MSQSPDDLRRRQMMQQSLARGLQKPQSLMPGESAGIPDFLSRGPKINVPAGAGLSLPQPATPNPNINMAGLPPEPNQPVTPPPASPRIGYSTSGLTGVDRLMQRRRALEEADPESRVTDTGEIEPPEKTGRLKGFGQFAGLAAAQADPDRPMYSLGQILGGGIAGAVSPRSAAKAQRQFDMRSLDNDIARGLKLEQEQAQLGSIEALRRQRELEPTIQLEKLEHERRIENEKLEIERRKAMGLITDREYQRRRHDLDRRSREKIAADRIASQEKIAATRPSGEDTRQAKSAAAQQEFDSLLVEEEAARQEKDRAYKVLDDMRKGNSPKEDIAQAEDAAKAADRNYQSYAEKKRDTQRRIRENQVSSPSREVQPYAGRTMSRANLERYAKDKGMSVEDAQREVEAQGVRVQ